MVIPNLLIIAGTGTKSGKTSLACRIIEQFSDLNIAAIKITPHFHKATTGLILISEKTGYTIYEETNKDSPKDTSRMLNAGADRVFFAKVWDDKLLNVFKELMRYLPSKGPVICESPVLRSYIEPGVFILMTSEIVIKHKDIKDLQKLPHIMLKLEDLKNIDSISIGFEDGKWFYKSEERSQLPGI